MGWCFLMKRVGSVSSFLKKYYSKIFGKDYRAEAEAAAAAFCLVRLVGLGPFFL